MKSAGRQKISSLGFWVVRVVTGVFLLVPALQAGQQSNPDTAKTTPAPAPAVSSTKTFDTPQQAADVLVAAAEEFDVRALEEIFGPDAEEFKVTRHPNPHIAFGCGEHSCIGAQLARLEATVLFDELLRRFPNLELVGEVDRMRATMIPGVKRMPVRLGTGR